MKNLLDYFICQKDENYVDFVENTKTRSRIQELEESFKNINFLEKNIYKQDPKYYLRNKKKQGTDDIQDGLRKKIEHLNNTYEDYTYFLDIDKTILSKKENKHTYNIYQVYIIEFKKINLFEDVIQGLDSFFPNRLQPFRMARLNDTNKLKLYEIIDDTINFCELFTKKETIETIEIKNYNKYLFYLKKKVLEFFIDLYDTKNQKIQELHVLFSNLDKHCHISNTLPILETLEIYYKDEKHYDTIHQIVDILINLNWDITMSILNERTLSECYKVVIKNEEEEEKINANDDNNNNKLDCN